MKFATSLAMIGAAALLAGDANAACTATVPTESNFNAENFAGLWNVQSSTYYANDMVGCVKMQASKPSARNQKIDIAMRSVSLFSWNPLSGGGISV